MQVHDDLSTLFSRNLTFNPELRTPAAKNQAPTQPITYSISQHYHHSAHAVKPQEQQGILLQETPERPWSEPPQSESLASENVLRIHGVDPSALTPSQVQLFRIADTPQQMRLIELWSICPPDGGRDVSTLVWSGTTLEQEEILAQRRYERLREQQAMTLDGALVQTGDGRWSQQPTTASEPYMSSGYEEIMRREREREEQATDFAPRAARNSFGTSAEDHTYSHAMDPVYQGPDYARQQQQMEMASQYGAFDQIRQNGEADAMDVM